MSISQQTNQGVVFLRSSLLAEGGRTVHGFSTRFGGVSEGIFASLNLGANRGDDPERVAENYRRFCAAVGADAERVVCAKQVHRSDVRVVTEADAGKGLSRPVDYEADGLITDVLNLPLVVFSADCIPVLLHDPDTGAVGACHCGWRGTSLGMAQNTVEAMCREYGCKPQHIRAAIGPGISRCCFETHRDVPDAMLQALGVDAIPCIDSLGGGKYKVDGKELNRIWLLRSGLRPEHIEVSPECTCCQPERYWSHRRVGNERGSLAAVIQRIR